MQRLIVSYLTRQRELLQSTAAYASMAVSNKRIIICCDGTYDDFGDTIERKQPGSHVSRIFRWLLPPFLFHLLWGLRVFPFIKKIERKILGVRQPQLPFCSNISHLASAIKPRAGDGVQQMVIYVGGIGALGTPQSRFEEAVTGNTMSYKVRYVYRYIVDNYVDGDEIFLFGYSRGAFTARAVVGLIRSAGILRKRNMDSFDAVWHAYKEHSKDSNDQTETQAKGSREAHLTNGMGNGPANGDFVHSNAKIRCVGVFDTVGSLKAPPLSLSTTDDIEIARKARRRYDNYDIDLGEIENVFQALALDERRFDFYPAVLDRSSSKARIFKQTWFPGVHADMGGRNRTILGLFPMAWMISKLQEVELLEFDDEYIRSNIFDPLVNADSKPRLQRVRPSHFIDRHLVLRQLIPESFLPWFRYAHRNPNMPARLSSSISETPSSSLDSETQPVESTGINEQMFHWTVIDRLINGKGDYWEMPPMPRPKLSWMNKFHRLLNFPFQISGFHTDNSQTCVALRKPNPLYPKIEISIADIKARVDPPTGIDKELFSQFQGNEEEGVIL